MAGDRPHGGDEDEQDRMSSLSPVEVLHNAFRETLHYRGKYAFVPQLLRDAERHLRGERVVSSLHAGLFFANEPVHHPCMDFPDMQCPACSGAMEG